MSNLWMGSVSMSNDSDFACLWFNSDVSRGTRECHNPVFSVKMDNCVVVQVASCVKTMQQSICFAQLEPSVYTVSVSLYVMG